MSKVKKVRVKVSPHTGRHEWLATAEDGSGLKATALKPKHAVNKLLGQLIERYQCEVEIEESRVYPAEIESLLKELDTAVEEAEKLASRIPMLRYKAARALHSWNIDQTTIAERIHLTQAYLAQFLQLSPEEVAQMKWTSGKRVRRD